MSRETFFLSLQKFKLQIQSKSQRGTSLVEFAVFIPVIVLIIFAGIDVATFFSEKALINDLLKSTLSRASLNRDNLGLLLSPFSPSQLGQDSSENSPELMQKILSDLKQDVGSELEAGILNAQQKSTLEEVEDYQLVVNTPILTINGLGETKNFYFDKNSSLVRTNCSMPEEDSNADILKLRDTFQDSLTLPSASEKKEDLKSEDLINKPLLYVHIKMHSRMLTAQVTETLLGKKFFVEGSLLTQIKIS